MAPIPPLTQKELQQAADIFVFCVVLELSMFPFFPSRPTYFPTSLNYWSCLNRLSVSDRKRPNTTLQKLERIQRCVAYIEGSIELSPYNGPEAQEPNFLLHGNF